MKCIAVATMCLPLMPVTKVSADEGLVFDSNSVIPSDAGDRLWVLSTRRLTSDVCRADLDSPSFDIDGLDACGNRWGSSLDEYLAKRADGRRTVIYVHGNRMEPCDAIERGLTVYQRVSQFRQNDPVDWLIFSWPSEQVGILARDVRIKADRADAEGLYLAWLLRKHAEYGTPTSLIGYSFGGRVVTGSLHALAGGSLGGRSLPGPPVTGLSFDAGLVAPAIASNWMNRNGYHSLATQNLEKLLLYYNQRDAVLKRYWLIDRVRGQAALGYSGPTSFAPRADGTKLPVKSRDCSPIVGLQHSEVDYYQAPCRAGRGMALMIDGDWTGF
ncbi:alpha/beta hydrolase [Rubripirellula tenax]|uniref:alpha/beta hydrolase n=1 Tax=Rubripirellula tenax TaxID=2528015 RepID=UPI0011B4AE34|nr:alpha/beta hydrolase [Rubripirellula tenax]